MTIKVKDNIKVYLASHGITVMDGTQGFCVHGLRIVGVQRAHPIKMMHTFFHELAHYLIDTMFKAKRDGPYTGYGGYLHWLNDILYIKLYKLTGGRI